MLAIFSFQIIVKQLINECLKTSFESDMKSVSNYFDIVLGLGCT